MVEAYFAEHWDWLRFRGYLIEHPQVAQEYDALKVCLALDYPNDRVGYTKGKTPIVVTAAEQAKRFYGKD